MFNTERAISQSAIKSLVTSYNYEWNGMYTMYKLLNLWFYKSTENCKFVKIRGYYVSIDNRTGSFIYWNADFVYDTCSNTYTYVLGSGNTANPSIDYNGLSKEEEKKLKVYFYNPMAYPMNDILNGLVQIYSDL